MPNTEKSKARRGSREPAASVFISKTEIADALRVRRLATIDRWIAEGTFPPPHSRPGKRTALWLYRHWQHYVERGEWPREAFPDRRGRA